MNNYNYEYKIITVRVPGGLASSAALTNTTASDGQTIGSVMIPGLVNWCSSSSSSSFSCHLQLEARGMRI